MSNFSKLSIALTLSTVLSTGSWASVMNSNHDTLERVAFAQPSPLAEFAMKGMVIPDNFVPRNYYEASLQSSMLLSQALKVDGVGAGAIVIDRDFEPNAALDLHTYDTINMLDHPEKVSHGTTVASLIASKADVTTKSLAAGAKIYAVTTETKQNREKDLSLERQIHTLKAQQKEMAQQYEKQQADLELRRVELKDQGKDEDAGKLLFKKVEAANDHMFHVMKCSADLENLMRLRLMQTKPVMSNSTLEQIQLTLDECRQNGQALPRVLCMSLPCTAGAEVEEERFQTLIKILEDNDMLFVLAASNEGDEDKAFVLGRDKIESHEAYVDFFNKLNDYPALVKRSIFVGAHFESDKIADYSAQAGSMKEHFLIADGNVINFKTYNEDGFARHSGDEFEYRTSYAAPRVASLAVVLGKYFPNLTMLQIKQIMLNTAFKQKNHYSETVGQGALFPMAAWNQAVRETNAQKKAANPGFMGKIKWLLKKK